MTVRDMLAALQHLPRDAEVLAFEAGCEEYCEREVDEVERQGGGSTCISASDATTGNHARQRVGGGHGRCNLPA
jgi:hypothetical protein